jgi:hypothetical protein
MMPQIACSASIFDHGEAWSKWGVIWSSCSRCFLDEQWGFLPILNMGTYHVYIGSPRTYRVHELIKFTKKSKKIIYVLSILLHLCIKFQRQIHNNE